MQYSVVIPTNRAIASLLPTLQSLQSQTIPAKEIVIVYDKILTQHDYDALIQVIQQNLQSGMISRVVCMTQLTHDIQIGKGVSYLRNKGIESTTSDYVLCIDDDNTVASDFIERLGKIASFAHEKYKNHALLVPTEYYRTSIRSRGYSGFSYLFGVPVPYHEQRGFVLGDDYVGNLQFCSSNCLFGHKDIFITHPFDEKIPFIYEDFVMTASVFRSGIPLLVTHAVIVNHNMRNKTPLEDSYISTPTSAYQKAKNRIIFVRVLGNSRQKRLYLLIGVHIHTFALMLKIIRYAPSFNNGSKLCFALLHGTWDGLFHTR